MLAQGEKHANVIFISCRGLACSHFRCDVFENTAEGWPAAISNATCSRIGKHQKEQGALELVEREPYSKGELARKLTRNAENNLKRIATRNIWEQLLKFFGRKDTNIPLILQCYETVLARGLQQHANVIFTCCRGVACSHFRCDFLLTIWLPKSCNLCRKLMAGRKGAASAWINLVPESPCS